MCLDVHYSSTPSKTSSESRQLFLPSGHHYLISSFFQVEVLTEPVAKWRDIQGHNLFELMYRDPCRWSMTFQSYVELTMTQLHMQPTKVSLASRCVDPRLS